MMQHRNIGGSPTACKSTHGIHLPSRRLLRLFRRLEKTCVHVCIYDTHASKGYDAEDLPRPRCMRARVPREDNQQQPPYAWWVVFEVTAVTSVHP